MRWTPLDIQRKKFRKALYGFSPREVEEFLKELSEAFEHLLEENQDATQRLEELEKIKKDLEETLLLAKKAAEEIVETAKKEAEVMKREKEVELKDLDREILALKRRRDQFFAEFEFLLNSFLEQTRKLQQKEASEND